MPDFALSEFHIENRSIFRAGIRESGYRCGMSRCSGMHIAPKRGVLVRCVSTLPVPPSPSSVAQSYGGQERLRRPEWRNGRRILLRRGATAGYEANFGMMIRGKRTNLLAGVAKWQTHPPLPRLRRIQFAIRRPPEIAYHSNHRRSGEMADAQDLKSWVRNRTCGFESRLRHHYCI